MMDPAMISFLKKHHLLTLATSHDNQPYCTSCFYAFLPEHAVFVIATDVEKTRHGKELLHNPHVAGTVALETKLIGKIQGVQFLGLFREAQEREKKAYFKRFPYALAISPSLWSIEITYLKLTDNTLGFGKKLEFFASNSLPNNDLDI